MVDGAGEETRPIVDRALAKLEAAAAAGPAPSTIDPGADGVDPHALALEDRLRRATDQQRQVRLAYYVPARDEESDRVVDPRGVVTWGGLTYLDAWCHSAEAPRLFRLDRIAAAEVLDTPIATPSAAPRDLAAGLFTQSEETTLVTLRLAPAARWVVEYYPVEAVRPRSGGAVEVDLLVADRRWLGGVRPGGRPARRGDLGRLLLRLAPHAQVITPEEYVADFAAAAQATLDLYS
jgi:proteasome accessory factor C